MGFRGQPFAFDSPAAAVAAMVGRAATPPMVRPSERVRLDDAAGRILAEDIRADRDSPAFDHAAMDGYAVRFADLTAPSEPAPRRTSHAITLPVRGESRIGEDPPSSLRDSRPAAVRIATGAPIPPGADTVIRRELVTEHGAEAPGEVASISIAVSALPHIKRGDNIRFKGENAPAGAVILSAGEALSAAGLATLVAAGATHPSVHPRLRIAVITTGEELVEPHHTPSAFQVRNSNAPALCAIFASHAWTKVVSVSHVRDEGDLAGALRHACGVAEALVLTGGVSMGHRDPVRAAVEQLGAEILFHGLPQRPGKPMLAALARRPEQQGTIPIFGLPGNPVSALVTCVRIVLPILAACAGATRTPAACLPCLVQIRNPDRRTLDAWWHRPVRLVMDGPGAPVAELVDSRGSGDIVAAGRSDGFVELPPASSGAIHPYYAWPAGARSPSGGCPPAR